MSRANRLRWQGNDPRREKLRQRNQRVRDGHTPYQDREWLRIRYEDQGMTLRQIASEAQCGLRTIARWMETHEITTRNNATAIRLAVKRGPDNANWRGGKIAEATTCPLCGVGLTRFREPIRVKRSGSTKGVEDGQNRQALLA